MNVNTIKHSEQFSTLHPYFLELKGKASKEKIRTPDWNNKSAFSEKAIVLST